MLTSSNQYLRPEYLTPLPTTLDAKKSPLALLAQTCSQIGADSSNNSKLLQSDKKTKESAPSKDKKSESPHKPLANFRPYENSSSREKSKTPEEQRASSASRVRTPNNNANKANSAANVRCGSNQSAASQRESPLVSGERGGNVERKTPASTLHESNSERPSTPSNKAERGSPQTPNTSKSSSSITPISDASKEIPLGAYKPSIPVTSAYLGAYPPGLPLGMDIMTSSLMSQHHALKASALSPYLNYARMKSPGDPLCRDPYCTGCGINSHLMPPVSGNSKTPTSCPAGCTQCDHATSKSAASYLGHNPAAAAYAHAQLAALAAASHLPYVCNWISGDAAYCGKRFSSSEELLTHLRTHTSVGSVSEASALSMLNASGLPPTHPLLHRTYPTPPLSPLATARYHPYTKPSLLPPSLTTSPLSSYPLMHPGIPPYLSPYSLYGPRLGAAPGMHP